ncbi:MAG: hypothetical protein ACRDY7_17235, partial [Acidimicrobiia bacterium]
MAGIVALVVAAVLLVAAAAPAPGQAPEASSEPRRRYDGTDPDRDPLPYSPFKVAEYPRPADPRQRAVLVTP